jgi:3-oxoacyl-(acyl-carrier-protein) synthase
VRVFVTGMGAVSCAAAGISELEIALQVGRSGLGPANNDYCGIPAAATVGLVRALGSQIVPRAGALLDLALTEAWTHADLRSHQPKIALFLGTAHGHLDVWKRGRGGEKRTYDSNIWDFSQGYLAKMAEATETTIVSTACTASSVALGLALDALRTGQTEIAVVAGVEAMTPFLYSGFASLRSLTRDCRPFDRERNGLVLGEGAAVVILEAEAHAERRHAAPLAEVAGFGFGSDAAHLTAPDSRGSGAAIALAAALAEAGMQQDLPDSINTHGTGTKLNDHMEGVALRRVFGADISGIPITATKPITGHLCGAAGLTELVISIVGMRNGTIPPILGFKQPDPTFDNFDFVHGSCRRRRQRVVVSMNSGFGGTNTAIVLREAGK